MTLDDTVRADLPDPDRAGLFSTLMAGSVYVRLGRQP